MNEDVQVLVEKIFSKYTKTKIPAGQIIIEPGQKIRQVHFVLDGKIRQYIITPEGDEITIHVYKPPVLIPLMVVLSDKPNSYYFATQSKTTVATAPVEEILPLLDISTDFWKDIATRFAGAIDGLSQRIVSATSSKQKEQLESLLIYLSSSFGQEESTGWLIKDKLSHADLANWLGCARETVSRMLKQLEAEEKIGYRNGHLVIYKKK